MLPGSSASGSFNRPEDAWNSQAGLGLNQTRPEIESAEVEVPSPVVRLAALNSDPSTVHLP
jgi:hypothetical protein